MMGVSHSRNTLGPPDHPGISPIAKGKPLPKRDRAWECAGGEEYYSGPQPGLNIVEAVGIRASRSGTGCRQSRSYATLMSKWPG